MGSAALYHLARRGAAPIGIDQFQIDHSFGSSWGHSRAIRNFYHDGLYVEWVQRALDLWRELEEISGQSLLKITGTIYFAREENRDFQRNLAVLKRAGAPFEMYSAAEIRRRFDGFHPPRDTVSCYTAEAGFLNPSRCVQTHVDQAVHHGAVVRDGIRLRSLDLSGNRPLLETSDGIYRCSRLILCCGPWTSELLPELKLPLKVTRQQKFYFSPSAGDEDRYRQLPVYADYDSMFYGFPFYGPGLKVADDIAGEVTHPDRVDRRLDEGTRDKLQGWVQSLLPDTRWQFQTGFTCMYTTTPDLDFFIGPHPKHPNLLVGGGFSGHGFKFSTLVGQLLAELATTGEPSASIERFRLDRGFPPCERS